jgi:hypothetical protein
LQVTKTVSSIEYIVYSEESKRKEIQKIVDKEKVFEYIVKEKIKKVASYILA